MELDDFIEFLEEEGIECYTAGKSLVIKSCPACGSEKFKVHLKIQRDDESKPFFGKCFKCDEGYSSIKYLLDAGVDSSAVFRIHGHDAEDALKKVASGEILKSGKKQGDSAPAEISVDTSSFRSFSVYPDHEATKYAERRGVDLIVHSDIVKIEPFANAVVFLCRDGENIVGYQKRFLYPEDPKFKTKSFKGFEKNKYVLEFPREGADILICEGPFTAVAAWRFGYYGICTWGAMVSNEQLEKIEQLAKKLNLSVGVAFDRDEAGQVGMDKIKRYFYWKGRKTFSVHPRDKSLNDLNDAYTSGKEIDKIEDERPFEAAIPTLAGWT